jgi:hypothetical protein
MVHLRKPVKVFQREIGAFGNDKPQMKEVPSPMMFQQPIYQYDEKTKKVELKTVQPDWNQMYLNAWNYR